MFTKRINQLLILAVLAFAMLISLAQSRPVIANNQAQPAQQQTNLLVNPGFEGNYSAWSGINEVQMASGWTPQWREVPDNYPQWFRPEYKRAWVVNFPARVRSGESAQQYFTFHASHFAGMYQQVFNVTPGQSYKFTIWAQVWSSTADDPNVSTQPANPHLQIGIDPTGLWQIDGGTVVWSPEAPMSNHIDKWGAISVEAVAQSDVITVMVRTSPEFPNKHNDMYWDDATLFLSGPPQPTVPPPPPPTNTPGPPTNTPVASNTPLPTNTPSVTDTPLPPPATNTPEATETAVPTDTAEPTETPEPTDTPAPTDTLAPTDTAEPPTETATAEPTEEPEVEGTEIAAVPTAEEEDSGETADNDNSTSNGDQEGDSNTLLIGAAILGLGVVIGLLAAGAVIFMRRAG